LIELRWAHKVTRRGVVPDRDRAITLEFAADP